MLLREYLHTSRMTAKNFADWVEVSPQVVWAWLRGDRKPDLEMVKKISRLTRGDIGLDDWPALTNRRRKTAERRARSNGAAAPAAAERRTSSLDADRFLDVIDGTVTHLVWRSGPDGLCNWFNGAWLDFVGRTIEQEIGNGWTENVHPDDFDHCVKTYTEAFEARQPFLMVYRLRRFDGRYRYILDAGAPAYCDNVFTGYIGGGFDLGEQLPAAPIASFAGMAAA